MYRIGADRLGVATNGVLRVEVSSTAVPTGGALCLSTNTKLSKCTGLVDGSGNCPCPDP